MQFNLITFITFEGRRKLKIIIRENIVNYFGNKKFILPTPNKNPGMTDDSQPWHD